MNYLGTVAMSDEELTALAKRLPMSDLVALVDEGATINELTIRGSQSHDQAVPRARRLASAARAEIDRRLPIPATVEATAPPASDAWQLWATRWEELRAALNLGALPSHERALARVQELVAHEAAAIEGVRVACVSPIAERDQARAEVAVMMAERDAARAEVERLRAEVAACKANGARMHDWWTALCQALGFNTAPGVTERPDLQEMALCRVAEMTRDLAKAKATAEQMFDRWAAMCDVLGYGPKYQYDAQSGVPTVEDVHRAALTRLREWSAEPRAEGALWQELCRALAVIGPGPLDVKNRDTAHKEALSEIRGLRQLERDVEEERDRPFWTRPR